MGKSLVSCFLLTHGVEVENKLLSIDDRGQTDRVTILPNDSP